MKRLARTIDRLAEWSGRGLAWLSLFMVLVGSWNALARWTSKFTGTDLSSNGLLEAQWYMFSVLFLLGASYTLKHDEHIRVDVIYGRLSERTRAWIDLVGSIALLIPFCVFALIVAFPGVMESWSIREISPDPGGLPRYPLKAVVLVAFSLLLMQSASEISKRVAILKGPKDEPDA